MKRKTKLYLKLNLVSLFFIAVSFISMTLAWFVYSGLSTVNTEVSVKAWYIELEKGGEVVSNNITISLDDIYPGMEPKEEEIKIKNYGDSDAQVKYEIKSIRIFDEEIVTSDEVTSTYLEDMLSHEYPVHINIDLTKRYILSKTDESTFKVSISWPLDSGSAEFDKLDSEWGTKAYKFKEAEQKLKKDNNAYQVRAPIKMDIKLTAEQYIETDTSNSDIPYRFGNEILFDIEENKISQVSEDCIRTNVIDSNNKISDEVVTLLPKISLIDSNQVSNYDNINTTFESQFGTWNATTRLLTVQDVLYAVSKDITSSVLVRPGISDLVIGNLTYEGRMDKILLKATSSNGLFKFLNKYSYFSSTDCYWLYDVNNDKDNDKTNDKFFVVEPYDEGSMKIYESNKTESCKVVPVIIANKKMN